MKYSIPTNWDDRLIEEIAKLKKDRIIRFYGKLHEDLLGGGRPAIAVPFVSSKKAAAHIKRIHSQGLKFNYLLNTSCFNNLEFSRKGQRQLREMLDWLSCLGIESVTVTIPYFLELLKKRYPHFRVSVSTMAHVNSLLKVKRWKELGADEITLSNTEANRNFRLFNNLKKYVSCKIQLICNANCLYCCPFHFYHANISSHSSQSRHASRGFVIDYCFLSCRLQHIMHPVDFIRSTWIRPEDTSCYEDAGIDSFKLIDRGMTTEALLRISRAYFDRSYDGNLMDLFRTPSKTIRFGKKNWLAKARYFFRPFSINIFKFAKGDFLTSDFDVTINNASLDGFIGHFLTHNCEDTSCDECQYCFQWAGKVLNINAQELLKKYRSYKDSLVSGDIFAYF